MSGKKQDVIIEDVTNTDPRTGVESVSQTQVNVWADERMKEVIQKVEGVTNVYNIPTPTLFHVYIDARYDKEYVKRDIEAAILCAE